MNQFFDKDEFLNEQIDELDEKSKPLPEGERSGCYIHKWEVKPGESDKGPWLALDISVKVPLSEDEKTEFNRDFVIISMDRIFLQCDWDSGKPVLLRGPQQNIPLGKLRAALDQNYKGWSFGALEGAGPFVAKVIQKMNQKNGDLYNSVPRIMAES